MITTRSGVELEIQVSCGKKKFDWFKFKLDCRAMNPRKRIGISNIYKKSKRSDFRLKADEEVRGLG